MAIIQIPNLPAVIGLDGSELFEGVQAGTSVKISASQIIAAAQIGTPLSLPLAVSIGGTGLTTFDVGDIMYASATQTLSKLSDVATGNAIISGGVGVAPSYGKIGLTTHISGVLPVANGGTNIASYAVGDILYASAAGVLSPLADVAVGNVILSGGIGAAPAYGKVDLTTHVSGVLPVANGGTNQSAALNQYGVIYGDTTTSMASTGAGTSTTLLHGNASGAPTFSAVSLTADVSGTLPVGNGGTGQASNLTQYGVVYGSTTTAMATSAAGTTTTVLHGNAAGAPTFGAVSLTADVSGTLPLANGGTGATTGAGAFANMMGYTTTATAAGTTVLTNTSTQYQVFTGATTQTITLPVTSTLTTGWTFHIVNNSTGNLTVNSSGGNLVCTVISGMTAMVTCIGTTLTTAADWEFGFTDFGSVTGTGANVMGTGPTITNGVYSGTVGASSPSSGAFTTVTASTSILCSGSAGLGYATGAGAAVTQLTSRTTTTPTIGTNKCGAITLFTAAPTVGTYFSFTVPTTQIAITDNVIVTVRGATNTYVASVTAIVANTSFQVTMVSVVGTASDTPIVNFAIIKGVSA